MHKEYYKKIFEDNKDNAFSVAIQQLSEAANARLPMKDQERIISIIKEVAKEYGVELTDTTY